MKELHPNPLDHLQFWFAGLSKKWQMVFATSVTNYFAQTDSIDVATDEVLNQFMQYLDSSDLSDKEIIVRTLFATRIIEFIISGWAGYRGWHMLCDIIDKLKLYDSISSFDISELGDDEDDEGDFREGAAVLKSWDRLMKSDLTDEQIAGWYLSMS